VTPAHPSGGSCSTPRRTARYVIDPSGSKGWAWRGRASDAAEACKVADTRRMGSTARTCEASQAAAEQRVTAIQTINVDEADVLAQGLEPSTRLVADRERTAIRAPCFERLPAVASSRPAEACTDTSKERVTEARKIRQCPPPGARGRPIDGSELTLGELVWLGRCAENPEGRQMAVVYRRGIWARR